MSTEASLCRCTLIEKGGLCTLEWVTYAGNLRFTRSGHSDLGRILTPTDTDIPVTVTTTHTQVPLDMPHVFSTVRHIQSPSLMYRFVHTGLKSCTVESLWLIGDYFAIASTSRLRSIIQSFYFSTRPFLYSIAYGMFLAVS